MSDVGAVFQTISDPLGIFGETVEAKKARKRSSSARKKARKPRTFTSGDSLLAGSPGSATAGTLLGS